ncbi:MAG: tetratricopeptide repeat protein [Symploca sp. SIO1C2]|nr:tetratricopeptide repeat protein [Symploca sp. SIO1C2]
MTPSESRGAIAPTPIVGQTDPNSSPQTELASGGVESNTINDRLDSNSDKLEDDNSYYKIHRFEGKAGEQIAIELTSSEFEPYLILLDPEGNSIGGDDGGSGSDAKIVVTLPSTGIYQIVVNAYEAGESGNYTLSWREATEADFKLAEAEQLNQQVLELNNQGRSADAIPLAKSALAILQQVLGEEHPDVAQNLNNLAALYYNQGRYSEAEPLLRQALEMNQRLLGEEHPNVASTINNLAALYNNQGRYSEAELLYRQSLEMRLRLLGDEHPDIASTLNNLAGLYSSQGRYSEAEPFYRQALEMRLRLLGDEHPDVAAALSNLALLYSSQGRYSEAEPLYRQALEMRLRLLGEEHPDIATNLNNLALLYQRQGRYSEAEPLLRQSLEMSQRLLGEKHPDIASTLNNLAYLYVLQGRYSEAEPLYRQALEMRLRLLGEEHPDIATNLNNLAGLYSSQGQYSKAEPLYRQALEMRQRLLGDKHPDVAASFNNLAFLYNSQGQYSKAEPLYRQALEMRQRLLGDEHPDVATSLNNLAFLYDSQGQYSEAEPLYRQALEIFQRLLGDEHPDVAATLNNLALQYWEQSDLNRAIDLLNQGTNIEEYNLDKTLAIGSERQKQDYMATISISTDATISLHLQDASNNPQAARLAFTTLLRRKGRILDAVTDNLQTLRQNLTPENQELLDKLATKRSQLAALLFRGIGDIPPQQYRQQIATLKAQVNELENTLSFRSAEFRTASQPVTIEAVQQLIPGDTALVELVLYYPVNLKAKPDEQVSEPHYAAYILHSQGEPQWVDLGAAEPINQLITEFRTALQNSSSPNIKTIARQLDEQLMQPIRPLLGNNRNLLLSPDSQLNLIPFAALVDESDRYLLENYNITYLTSGRDLLKLELSLPHRSQPLIVANPDYSSPGETSPPAPLLRGEGSIFTRGEESVTEGSVPPFPRREGGLGGLGNRRSNDFTNLQFGPLPGTKQEAQAIAPMFLGAQLLTESLATENAIKQVQSPSILHIATHGFFLKDIEQVAAPDYTNPFSSRANIGVEYGSGKSSPTKITNLENPLLRSGLALAGINLRQSGTEDGVLTALETAGLNLSGTKLVVLSACETGVGDIANGEGVYGLRRALVMAGAESQLFSLWKVDDTGTKDLMVKYYQRLLKNEGRSQALRQTQLEMLRSQNYQHPYYWAAFIPSGDWKPMPS